MWILLALACQQPFGTDRHDLNGFRLAALRVRAADGVVHPEAVVVQGGRLWSDRAPILTWGWLDHPDDIGKFDETWGGDDQGTAPTLAWDGTERWLGVVAQSTDGELYRAALRVPAEGAALPDLGGVEVAAVEGLTLNTVQAEDLDARENWTTRADATLAPGDFALFSATIPENAFTRWMSLGGAGTFIERDAASTHWVAGELERDDETLTDRTPLAPGLVSFLTLALDPDTGGTDFALWEHPIGEAPATLILTGGRHLPADEPQAGLLLQGVLAADDTSPCGLRLTEIMPATAPLPPPECTGGVPFHPDALATARCTRASLTGQMITVQPQ